MNAHRPIWIGADPGGSGKFGIAILPDDGEPETACVDCAGEAVAYVRTRLNRAPAGVGVDAPLWWSSGRSGDRAADQWLRENCGLSGGQVQAANSLRGAALTQGAMFVQRLREAFPRVPVTESHPKALLKVFADGKWQGFARRFGLTGITPRDDNQRDALIAAVSAREGFQGRWPNDLSLNRLASEQDPSSYWLAPVHYYWPAS